MLLKKLRNLKLIPIENVYYMLAYAFEDPVLKFPENLNRDEFDNIYCIFALLLGNGMGRLVKQGLYRDYINRCDDLPVLRGKIDMAGTIKHKIAHRMLLSCEYDEFSENILLNRILKTTAMLLLQNEEVSSASKDILKKVMHYFSGITVIDYTSIPWSSINFHQNNRAYQSLIRICEFVIKRLLPSHKTGGNRLVLIDDNWKLSGLYEKFIYEYFKREFKDDLEVAFQPKLKWVPKEKNNSKLLPGMKMDIVLSDRTDKKKTKEDMLNILIIDAKFYNKGITTKRSWKLKAKESDESKTRSSKPKLRSDNLYQIFSYVHNMAAHMDNIANNENHSLKASGKLHNIEAYVHNMTNGKGPSFKVSGMLLYAGTNKKANEPQPHEMFDMLGKNVYAWTLDLSQNFSGIKKDLNLIAETIFKIKKEA